MPFPYYVLGLDPDAADANDDAVIADRYHALLRRFPPDRAPDEFRILRAAYEALRDERARIHTRLFYFDEVGTSLTEDLPRWIAAAGARRAKESEIADLLRNLG